jgi:nucleotidyltransferase substrate binding protein (TIGR01987 family)
MTTPPDIRWLQRLSNFRKALGRLLNAVELQRQRPLSDLEQQGLIQAFEFTHELAWNTVKDWLEYQGHNGVMGSRDAFREAFRRGLVEDGAVWMAMITSRNRSSHTYDQATADSLTHEILTAYAPAFTQLLAKLEAAARS